MLVVLRLAAFFCYTNLAMFKSVDPKPNFPKLEEKILQFWKEDKVFEKSLENHRGAGSFVFYEGPPTANGRPGIHHVLARAFKDLFPRYKTMQGFYCERKGGWIRTVCRWNWK